MIIFYLLSILSVGSVIVIVCILLKKMKLQAYKNATVHDVRGAEQLLIIIHLMPWEILKSGYLKQS